MMGMHVCRSVAALLASAILMVLATSLPAAETARRIAVAFEPVDVDSAYQKRATWQETLRATIETLRNDHPALRLGRCRVDDKWFRAGPYAWPAGKGPSTVDFGIPLSSVDLKAERPDGTRLWTFEGPVKAEEPYAFALPAGSSVFHCRSIHADFAGSLDMALGSDVPLTLWLNGETCYELAANETDLWNPMRLTLEIRKGRNEVMIRFDNPDGPETAHFYVRFNNPAATWNGTVEQIREHVVRDFSSPRDAFEQKVDFDAKVWLAPLQPGDAGTVSRDLAERYVKAFENREHRDMLAPVARDVDDSEDLWVVRSAWYYLRLLLLCYVKMTVFAAFARLAA